MALDKEHPKIMIDRIIFLVSVIRLDKPVVGSLVLRMNNSDEILVATSFPLDSRL